MMHFAGFCALSWLRVCQTPNQPKQFRVSHTPRPPCPVPSTKITHLHSALNACSRAFFQTTQGHVHKAREQSAIVDDNAAPVKKAAADDEEEVEEVEEEVYEEVVEEYEEVEEEEE